MKKNHNRTPIFDTIYDHAKRNVVSFHTPGHKNGNCVDKEFLDFSGPKRYFSMKDLIADIAGNVAGNILVNTIK